MHSVWDNDSKRRVKALTRLFVCLLILNYLFSVALHSLTLYYKLVTSIDS